MSVYIIDSIRDLYLSGTLNRVRCTSQEDLQSETPKSTDVLAAITGSVSRSFRFWFMRPGPVPVKG